MFCSCWVKSRSNIHICIGSHTKYLLEHLDEPYVSLVAFFQDDPETFYSFKYQIREGDCSVQSDKTWQDCDYKESAQAVSRLVDGSRAPSFLHQDCQIFLFLELEMLVLLSLFVRNACKPSNVYKGQRLGVCVPVLCIRAWRGQQLNKEKALHEKGTLMTN